MINLKWWFGLAVPLLLAACGRGTATQQPPPATVAISTPAATHEALATRTASPAVTNPRVDPERTYRIPPPLIPPDGIPPVYEPRFAPADKAPLQADELVIGIAREGEAKAYPISVLRFREMVNDELAGLPILVTW